MYFSVFPSSEYNEDINNDKIIRDDKADTDICIICWSPEYKNNNLYLLSDIQNITLDCNCDPKLHQDCLNNWLIKSRSCPICRKNFTES